MRKTFVLLSVFFSIQIFSQEVYQLDKEDKVPVCFFADHLWIPIYFNHSDECKCDQSKSERKISNAFYNQDMDIFIINPQD